MRAKLRGHLLLERRDVVHGVQNPRSQEGEEKDADFHRQPHSVKLSEASKQRVKDVIPP